ncbi:helix-turn-helix domain-containing protein [Streptomyces sp. NPDC002680]|uniref:helix-turn-helix domain-containing protein n=1 Tax=Streptomyces sp. NPDC002680 TaxID=3364659 RepID=UPI0036B0D071
MNSLLMRLSALDADAANAMRVIGFFDALITSRVSLRVLARQTAQLAECPAGITDSVRGVSLCSNGTGRTAPDDATCHGFSDGGQVWIERAGEPLPLDDILLERFAIAASLLSHQASGPLPKLGDAALVELALSASAGDMERARAVRLMGLDPGAPVCVLAVADDHSGIRETMGRLSGARVALLGRLHAVLVPHPPPTLPTGMRVGVGPALPGLQAPESWLQARTALRFALPNPPGAQVVHAEQLGSLAAIAAAMSGEDIARIADVRALDTLAALPHGAGTLEVLVALCTTGSVRKAAASVYRHPSTVAARLERAESHLGFSFTAPAGRLRLELALLLRRLRETAE